MSVERRSTPLQAGEAETALAFLEYQRATVLLKADGLDAAGLARALHPSTMTLGGLLKHCAYVEHWWIREVFRGRAPEEPWASVDWAADEDWDWHSAAGDDPADLTAMLRESIAASRAAMAGAGLDELSARPIRGGEHVSLRWIVLHLIEEYARHAGHADLLREAVDGTTGQ